MCFEPEYDWYADVTALTESEAGARVACEDCGELIHPGDWRRYVYQQEHEECQRCEWEELEPGDEPCDTHDYGETWECSLCRDCCNIRAAISAVEADEGCRPDTREPAYGELDEALRYDDGRYVARVRAWFPRIKSKLLPVMEEATP